MTNLDLKKYNLSKDLSKAAKVETYGLHYDINWIELIARSMAIYALEIDDDKDYYSDDERELITARLGVIGTTKNVIKSSYNNQKSCCN
jgi:hypothetical protein